MVSYILTRGPVLEFVGGERNCGLRGCGRVSAHLLPPCPAPPTTGTRAGGTKWLGLVLGTGCGWERGQRWQCDLQLQCWQWVQEGLVPVVGASARQDRSGRDHGGRDCGSQEQRISALSLPLSSDLGLALTLNTSIFSRTAQGAQVPCYQ